MVFANAKGKTIIIIVKNYKVILESENSHMECRGPRECRKSSDLRRHLNSNSCSSVNDHMMMFSYNILVLVGLLVG